MREIPGILVHAVRGLEDMRVQNPEPKGPFPQMTPEIKGVRRTRIPEPEGPMNLGPHLVACPRDGGPEKEVERSRRDPEGISKPGHPAFKNPLRNPSPPGMQQGNASRGLGNQIDRHAVCHRHREEDPVLDGEVPVRSRGQVQPRPSAPVRADRIPMDLTGMHHPGKVGEGGEALPSRENLPRRDLPPEAKVEGF
jgi:hypothetical protein